MDFKNIRVLVPEGGKQALAMIRGLKELGCYVTVICGTKLNPCYSSNKPDIKLLWKNFLKDDQESFAILERELVSGKYDVLMPIGEFSTSFVNRHDEELKKYVKLACAPREAYMKVFNKQVTFDHAMQLGIPCPYTRVSDQPVDDFIANAHFPVIIKPRQGVGSIGFHKFNTVDDLQKKLLDPSFCIDEYVLQEFVEFEHRIGALTFMDSKGNVCTNYATDVLRWFPLDAGSAILIKAADAPEILEQNNRLLKALHWQGYSAACYMIEKGTGQPKLLEINGRIPATVKLAYLLGFNIAQQMLELAYGAQVTQYSQNKKFDIYVRHFDTELAWFLKSPDRFRANPSWFSWKNTWDVLYSSDDKMPFFTNLWLNVKQYRKKMKMRSH